MGLQHSSFLLSFSDRVWLAPVPRQYLNAFRYGFLQYRHLFWAAVLMGMRFTSGAKHNHAKFRIIWHNVGQKAYFLAYYIYI